MWILLLLVFLFGGGLLAALGSGVITILFSEGQGLFDLSLVLFPFRGIPLGIGIEVVSRALYRCLIKPAPPVPITHWIDDPGFFHSSECHGVDP